MKTKRTCSLDGCSDTHKAKGYCARHYKLIVQRSGSQPSRKKQARPCSIEGCRNVHTARGFCKRHYTQFVERGSIEVKYVGRPTSETASRKITKDGYVYIRDAVNGNASGYSLEHRLVMENHLGRFLLKTETVHHIDGDRANNLLANLQLRSGQHGPGIAMQCLECGSDNIAAVHLKEGKRAL